MTSHDTQSRKIKTTETIFAIVEALQELDGAKGSEIADYLDLAPSTVSDHLSTLESMKYVAYSEDGYQLGLKFLDHGIYAANQSEALEEAQPLIREIAQETAETVWFHVEEHDNVVAVYREEGDHGIRTDWRGKFLSLHCTAPGKAILAQYPESRIHTALDKTGLPKVTENTITDRDELLGELEEIRDRGFALSDGEAVKNVRAIASPIVVENKTIGAITVGGYRHRVTEERFCETIPELILGVTNEIEFGIAEHDYSDFME